MNDIQYVINDFYADDTYLYNQIDKTFKLQIENSADLSLEISLSDYLYKNYYCGLIQKESTNDQKKNFQSEQANLVDGLKKAAGGYKVLFDCDWKMEEKDHSGNVYAKKGYLKNIVGAGHYLVSQYSNDGASRESSIQKAMVPYKYQKGDYFIFFNGHTPAEAKGNFLVRFYFNTNADNVEKLIGCLVEYLNKIQLPFEMKCPVSPSSYDRDDTVVLYLNTRFANYFLSLINPLYSKIEALLETPIPLFTKKLYPGIGFAESPPDNNTSFGMSRCDLLSQGIYSSIAAKLPQEKWYNKICEDLASQHFDINSFYLNPYNHYPYDIS